MAKQKQKQEPKKVVVTTDKRGVFFGTLINHDGNCVDLADARNCLYWSAETRGFIGLAAIGPQPGSRIGPAAPSIHLIGVTSIIECTPIAIQQWESDLW